MSIQANAKSSGQKSTRKLNKKQPPDQLAADAPVAASEETLLHAQPESVVHAAGSVAGSPLAASAEPAAPGHDVARSEESAEVQAVLTAVQDGVDIAGETLLVAAQSPAGKKEDEDDKAAGWHWSDALPWVAALGGIALIARSSDDDAAPLAPSGAAGVVWDTPVANAIVFRDSDGDGMWKDVNGDGVWQAGDEYITSTNEAGEFTGLGGSGLIVATSMDRLVATNGKSGEEQVLTRYSRSDAITDSRGNELSGDARDIGADLEYGTADDYVWSGAYVAPEGSGIYVTGVSTLVAAYLRAQGVESPTQAQVIGAANDLAAVFASDYEGGAITTYAQAIEFFTGSLNAQITKLMGAVAGQAQAEGAEGADLIAAVNAAIAMLAQAAINLVGSNEGTELEFGVDNPIDLTSADHLQEIFGYDTLQSEAYAAQTASAGPAVYTIWFNQDGSAVASPDVGSIATITRDGPLGNITVLATDVEANVDLSVQSAQADSLQLQGSLMQVHAAAELSTADLGVAAVSGVAEGVRVLASAEDASASARVDAGGAIYTREVQYFVLQSYLADNADILVEGDEIALVVEGETLAYAVTADDLAADDVAESMLAHAVEAFNAQAQAAGLNLTVATEYEEASPALFLLWGDLENHDLAEIQFNEETLGFELIQGTLVDGNPVVDTEFGAAELTIRGDVAITASGACADASLDLNGDVRLEGAINVTASSTDAVASANVNVDDAGSTVLGSEAGGSAVTITADGTSAYARAELGNVSGQAADMTVTAGGADSGDTEFQAFDFLGYFEINGFSSGDVFSVTVDGQTLDYTLTSEDYGASLLDVLDNVVASFNTQAEDLALDVTFGNEFDFPSLTIAWGSPGDQELAALSLNDTALSLGEEIEYYEWDGAAPIGATADLNVEVAGDATLALDQLTVSADAGSLASADLYGAAGERADGALAVSGDVTVNATGTGARAWLDVNEPSDGNTVLSGGAIGVRATGDAMAQASLYQTSGLAGPVTVAAGGNSALASLDIEVDGGSSLTLDSVSVTASNGSEDAGAVAYADIYTEEGDSTVAITGDIFVMAAGEQSLASADIDPVLGGEDGGSNVVVGAVAASADAWLGLVNTSGAAAVVAVVATAESADAEADIHLSAGDSLSVESIDVYATADDAGARLGIYGTDDDSGVHVSGPIAVTAQGDSAYARVYLVDEDSRSGDVTLGGEAGGSGISVEADAAYAEAHAHIYNAGGAAGQVWVQGSGDDSYAHIELEAGAGRSLSLDSLTVSQIEGDSGEAYAQVWTASDSADVAITGDITVSASGMSTDASAEINVDQGLNPYDGSITLGQDLGDEAVGSNIAVSATADSADASLNLAHGQGTIADITVSAAPIGAADRTYIVDGGDDQYDDGNFIGSDFAEEIAYSPTVVSGNFGAGSQNVAVYQDSVFGMLVTGNQSDTFSVYGETGSDGDGSEDLITEVAEYNGYRAVFQRTYGDDSSINRVFIYQASDAVSAAELDDDTDTDDFTITGLAEVDSFAYFVLFGGDGVNPISEADLTAFFHAAVDNVLDSGEGPLPIADMQSAFYDSEVQAALRGDMGLYDNFTNDDDGPFSLAAGGIEDASADANIEFSGDVQGDIAVVAHGDGSEAMLQLYSAAADGRVNLLGSDLTVSAAGNNADAHGWISSASGDIGDIVVDASGVGSQAGLSVASAVDGQHQQQRISVAGDNTLLGHNSADGLWLNVGGMSFEHELDLSYYSSRDAALTEFVRAVRHEVYAATGATLTWDHDALVLTWPDYGYHAPVEMGYWEASNSNVHTVIATGHAVPVLAFNGGEVSVHASAASAEAYADVSHATGLLSGISVVADAANLSCDANANAEADLGFNGMLSGDVTVAATNGEHNFASLDLHTDGAGGIAVEYSNFHVSADGEHNAAALHVDGLDGTVGNVDVYASGAHATAEAELRFVDGGVGSADVVAEHHTASAALVLDQSNAGSQINVAGDGHAAVTLVVDERGLTDHVVDLSGLRNDDADGYSARGIADIDLMARHESAGLETGSGAQITWSDWEGYYDDVYADRLVINGFNNTRDSINLLLQGDPRTSEWADDVSASLRQDIAFGADIYGGGTVLPGEQEAYVRNQLDNILRDATTFFDGYGSEDPMGFYYGEVTVTVDNEVDYDIVRKFLVYDFDLATDGISGLIELTGSDSVTGFNVADRYDLAFETDGYRSESSDLVGTHVIDTLTVGAYNGAFNSQEISSDGAVWLGDITLQATGYGDNDAFLEVCNDSVLELRQSDILVTAYTDGWDSSADAHLSLDGYWDAITGVINTLTVDAGQSAAASARVNYFEGAVRDVTVRNTDDDSNAYGELYGGSVDFEGSVIRVQAGSSEDCEGGSVNDAWASLDINRHDDGWYTGTISELTAQTNGWGSSAGVQVDGYLGDIDQLNVVAEGGSVSASADVEFNNDYGPNAMTGIRVAADGWDGPAYANAWVHAVDSSSDIQMTGEGDIEVSAVSDAYAQLDMDDMPVSGQVRQITVEADNNSDAYAWIQGLDFSVTHVRDDLDNTSTWNDSGIRVSAGDWSEAGLYISGYGEYLDSAVVSAGYEADAQLRLNMTGYVDQLDIEMTGDYSYASVDLTQGVYGGAVSITNTTDEPDLESWVDLSYSGATARSISVDDGIQLDLGLYVDDLDTPYTSRETLLNYYTVRIDGFSDDDNIDFGGEWGDAYSVASGDYWNYEENENSVSITQLFSDANESLDGVVDYYFGVSGGNGYLFHDADGAGITTVVELLGVTTFSASQINGYEPNPI